MNFDEVVREVVDRVPGGMAALLMGTDGIPLASYVHGESEVEPEVIGVEYANLLSEVRKAADVLDSGTLQDVSIAADRFAVLVRPVTADYFLALAINSQGNIGKGRFVLRVYAAKLQPEL